MHYKIFLAALVSLFVGCSPTVKRPNGASQSGVIAPGQRAFSVESKMVRDLSRGLHISRADALQIIQSADALLAKSHPSHLVGLHDEYQIHSVEVHGREASFGAVFVFGNVGSSNYLFALKREGKKWRVVSFTYGPIA